MLLPRISSVYKVRLSPVLPTHSTLLSHYSRSIGTMSTSHFSIKEHKLAGQYVREYPGALLDNQEDTLQLHIKQYTPLDKSNRRPGAVTIIGAHANGFPKVCQPLIIPFYQETDLV